MNSEQLISVASRLGHSLHKCGAETFRVEDSITRVLLALGAEDISVFVINSCIIFSFKTSDGTEVSDMKRCLEKSTDLYKLDKLNSLCRSICSGGMQYEQIILKIDEIDSFKPHCMPIRWIGYILASVGFAVVFGGGFYEALAAGLASFLVYPLVYLMEKAKTGIFFKNIIASALIALFVILFTAFIHPIQIDKTIIGIFMTLVPGVAITTSMRDIIAGDLISGKNILTEAIVIALGMALGAGITMSLLSFLI